jgi:hypothetical protein
MLEKWRQLVLCTHMRNKFLKDCISAMRRALVLTKQVLLQGPRWLRQSIVIPLTFLCCHKYKVHLVLDFQMPHVSVHCMYENLQAKKIFVENFMWFE